MDYKKLYAAMLAEIKKRNLNIRQLSRNCGDGSSEAINNWIKKNSAPVNSANVFKTVMSVLGIDIFAYADLHSIGGRIEAFRLFNGANRKELAIKIGVSSSTITEWEGNRGNPRKSHIDKLAVILDISAGNLLYGFSGEKHDEALRSGLVFLQQPTVQIAMEEAQPVVEEMTATESVNLCDVKRELAEAIEILGILGLVGSDANLGALNIIKNSMGVDILALAGNPKI